MEIAVAVLLSLAIAWIVLAIVVIVVIVVLVVRRPDGLDVGEAKRLLPDVIRLLRALSRDPSAGRGVRVKLTLLLVYLASPIDLVPDFIPVVGYADDIILVGLVLRHVVRRAGPDSIDRNWTGSESGLTIVRRLAGLGQG